MEYFIKLIILLIIGFFISLLTGVLLIKLLVKKQAKQTILGYVDNHKEKAGTPTLGGFIFLIPCLLLTLIFSDYETKLGFVALATTIAYGLLGFLDDFIKIKHKENLGLKAYQKIIGQLGIAVIVSVFAYKNSFVNASIDIPFYGEISLGWWFLPFSTFIFIAVTNAVNLTDGLDGLAGTTSLINIFAFVIILIVTVFRAEYLGDILYSREMQSLGIFSIALCGGVLGFLWFNAHPAKIFMGDTGSLALGGAIATISIFTKTPLLIMLSGIMFIVSSISVIIQVISFKLKGKRVFLMAPYHHHLQYKGIKENKIVSYYGIITFIGALISFVMFYYC